jgi:hypothetical protein
VREPALARVAQRIGDLDSDAGVAVGLGCPIQVTHRSRSARRRRGSRPPGRRRHLWKELAATDRDQGDEAE